MKLFFEIFGGFEEFFAAEESRDAFFDEESDSEQRDRAEDDGRVLLEEPSDFFSVLAEVVADPGEQRCSDESSGEGVEEKLEKIHVGGAGGE